MSAPVILTREQQEESANRDLREKRRKNMIFAKSIYLDGMDLEPVNERPCDVEVRTLDQGVEVSGDENHQDSLRPYGYDAWVWVYVVEGKIPKGKYEGYPTYWVYLDGEEIGYISKYQMERHCGQVPGDGASMIAHIPDRAKDREVDRLQLRLHMPFEHEPVDLSSQVVRRRSPRASNVRNLKTASMLSPRAWIPVFSIRSRISARSAMEVDGWRSTQWMGFRMCFPSFPMGPMCGSLSGGTAPSDLVVSCWGRAGYCRRLMIAMAMGL